MQVRMDATRQHVEIAHGLIPGAPAQEAAGKMPREQAQQAASKLHYDGSEYFWINAMQPSTVLNGTK